MYVARWWRATGDTLNDQPRAPGRADPAVWVGIDPSQDYTRPPPLSRPRIVRTALGLVDEKGLAALTMRALATELEVSPMALYNHVQDKDELVAGYRDAGVNRIIIGIEDMVDDKDLRNEIQKAVDEANKAVSRAEAIRKFRILPVDFTEDTGELTPTMKVKRNVVAEKFASDIEAIYEKD